MPTDEHAAFVAAANAETRVPTPDVPALTYETLPTYVSTLRGTIMGLAARIEGLTHSMEQLRTANVDLERQTQHGTEKESSLASELRDKTTALLRVQRQLDVQADELRSRIEAGEVGAEQDTVLVDVRNKTEFSHGTVADARQLNAGKVLFHQDELPQDKTLVTFCQSGLRTIVAAQALRRAGFDVVELEGSYSAWQQA